MNAQVEHCSSFWCELSRDDSGRPILLSARDAAKRAATVALARQRRGTIDFLTLLDSQRTLADAEADLASSRPGSHSRKSICSELWAEVGTPLWYTQLEIDMPLSLYDISVPVMIEHFSHLKNVLKKGQVHSERTGTPDSDLLSRRLATDMMPLAAQVQRASDTAKFAVVRIGQIPNVRMPDRERNFDELYERIASTVNFLNSVPTTAFDGREQAEVVLPTPQGPRTYTGQTYLLDFALPNFFFHVTTAYNILRNEGVPLGKADYLGWR